MADVKTYKCFPTLIHEFVLDIPTDDKTLMTKYIENFKGVLSLNVFIELEKSNCNINICYFFMYI